MAYAILRFSKRKAGGVAGADRHNERKKQSYKSNPDIDIERIKDNYHLIKPQGTYKSEYMKRIQEAGCRVRSDSVVMVETLITASPEFMNGLSKEKQKEFFNHALDFISREVGQQNIISAVVHMDETTPHGERNGKDNKYVLYNDPPCIDQLQYIKNFAKVKCAFYDAKK